MRLLNPHDVFWLSMTKAEAQIWFDKLRLQHEPFIDFGEIEDARPYTMSLIQPGVRNPFTEAISRRTEKVPAHIVVAAGKVIGLLVTGEVRKEDEA